MLFPCAEIITLLLLFNILLFYLSIRVITTNIFNKNTIKYVDFYLKFCQHLRPKELDLSLGRCYHIDMLKNTTKTNQRPDQANQRPDRLIKDTRGHGFTRFLDERLARTRISLDLTFTLVCAILLLVKVLFAPGPLGPVTPNPDPVRVYQSYVQVLNPPQPDPQRRL